MSTIQYNTISFIGNTKKVRAPADTAATGAITQYLEFGKLEKLKSYKTELQVQGQC